jgi:hypothetical protein
MQRRKLLAGIGSMAAGGAAMMGTGAFSTVENLDRGLTVETTGDASALLAFRKARDDPNTGYNSNAPLHSNADEYVGFDNGKIYIDLSETDAGATGANKGADTKFSNLFDIINQGSQEVNVGLSNEAPGNLGVFAEGNENDGSLEPQGGGGGFSMKQSDFDPATIGPGEVVENIGIAWDGGPDITGDVTLTFKADRTDKHQT